MANARVQLIAASGVQTIPPQFVRPVDERPVNTTYNGDVDSLSQIPIIDLSALDAPDLRQKTLTEIASACQQWGIFQAINHGISQTLIKRLQSVGKQFFDLPQEEKETYANNADNGIVEGYGTKLAQNLHGKMEWIDYYFHMLWPPSQRDLAKWPEQPPSYSREVVDEYGKELPAVVNKLLLALSISLGLQECALKDALGGENLEMEMKINYYPPCPEPEVALGVEPHTDLGALTVLVPDNVSGLQVYKDGNWITAHYVPNGIFINMGDQIQILSNGIYKSVLHRSLVHKDKLRMSWAVFCVPPLDTVIGPLTELTNDDNPPLFNAKTFGEYKFRKLNKLSQ
eukprot:Gb_19823 [translate_table: standard]